MSTTNFNADNAAIFWGGTYAESTSGGHGYRQITGQDGEFRTTITGTAATLAYFSSDTGPLYVTVDGTTTSVTLTAFTWTTVTLFTGLSDTAHSVAVRAHAASTFFVEKDTGSKSLQVTGSSPALALPSGYNFSDRRAVVADQSAGTPVTRFGGIIETFSTAGYALWQNIYSGTIHGCGSLRFAAKCTQIDIWGYVGNILSGIYAPYRLYIDGVGQPPVAAGPISGIGYGKVTLATGLDATTTHTYEIVVDDGVSYHQIYEVLLTGGTGFSTRPAARNTLAAMGDSITIGTLATASTSYPQLVANALGLSCANAGIASSTVSTAGVAPMVNRTGSLTQFGSGATKILVCGGVNDAYVGASSSTFQTAYLSLITSLASGCPNADIYCLAILPNNYVGFNQATISTFRTATQAAVASLGNSRVRYVDTSGWASTLAPGGDWTVNFAGDALHPNGAGHVLLAGLVLQAIGAAGAGGIPAGRAFGGI